MSELKTTLFTDATVEKITGENKVKVSEPATTKQSLAPKSLLKPDDYVLEKVNIISELSDGTVSIIDLRPVLQELSYHEDIFRGAVTGHVMIADTQNLIDQLALNGSEILELTYIKSKSSDERTALSKVFRIFRAGNRIRKNYNTEVYSLHFCSEELLLSEQIRISKAFQQTEISKIVNYILTEVLSVGTNEKNEKNIRIDPTWGVYDFVLPNKKPFETINWLANYAQYKGAEQLGADFIFFENREGFNFVSLQSLYRKQPYRYFLYTPTNVEVPETAKVGDMEMRLRRINAYHMLDSYDSLYGTTMGVFANRTYTIDPLTRRTYISDFDYNKYFPNGYTLNEFGVSTSLKNRKQVKQNEQYSSVFKMMVTNRDWKQSSGIKDVVGQYPNAVPNDFFYEQTVPFRTAQLSVSQYSRIQLSVPGDPLLTVGDVVILDLPTGRNSDSAGNPGPNEYDSYHSGRYLITAVRHIMDHNLRYETMLEVSKDSFSDLLPSYETFRDKLK